MRQSRFWPLFWTATVWPELVHEKYPEVNLEILCYSGANTTQYLQNMLAADDLPDICTQTVYDPNINDMSDKMIDLSSYDFTDNYVESRLQDVSDDGAIYMLSSVYSCIGITYNKTLLEVHGWELPKFFADLETWQRKQRRRGYSCAWHRSNIRKNRSKICVDFLKRLLT